MTAGQRNCYESLAECLDRYSFDDVLFALGEHAKERRNDAGKLAAPSDLRMWLRHREQRKHIKEAQ